MGYDGVRAVMSEVGHVGGIVVYVSYVLVSCTVIYTPFHID